MELVGYEGPKTRARVLLSAQNASENTILEVPDRYLWCFLDTRSQLARYLLYFRWVVWPFARYLPHLGHSLPLCFVFLTAGDGFLGNWSVTTTPKLERERFGWPKTRARASLLRSPIAICGVSRTSDPDLHAIYCISDGSCDLSLAIYRIWWSRLTQNSSGSAFIGPKHEREYNF